MLDRQKVQVKPVQEKTVDPNKITREFLGLDLTPEELKQLALGEMRLQISDDGSITKYAVESTEPLKNFKYRLVAFMMARGFSKPEIAQATGYTVPNINRIAKTPWVRELATVFQDKILDKLETDKKLALARLGQLSQEAVDTLEEGLTSENEDIRHKSAVKILEGIGLYGKAQEKQQNIDIGIQLVNAIVEGKDREIIDVE